MFKKFNMILFAVLFFFFAKLAYADNFENLDSYIVNFNLMNSQNFNLPEKNSRVVLGDERIFTPEFNFLIDGKNVGVVMNQTSVNSMGISIRDTLLNYKNTNLRALYAPEHGIDGKAKAGDYVKSYIDKNTKLPVFSLYADTREPTGDMLSLIDVLLFDLQDIGSRTYTYISTMNKCMLACKKYNKKFVVLDRPNPISCKFTEGYVLEDGAKSFVGVDRLPMAHGMTAGEIAFYFNRNIGCDLVVVPMQNYTRDMIWQDTGLDFVQTSPYIPNINSCFCYMATGQSENMGIGMGDNFTWSGGKGIDSYRFANILNSYGLDGVNFVASPKGDRGGVRLEITDYHKFNPAKTGYYIMATANSLKPLNVQFWEKSGARTMFYLISGNKDFGNAIVDKKSAFEIENQYKKQCEKFLLETSKYHIYI